MRKSQGAAAKLLGIARQTPADEKLPSVRALMAELQVSQATLSEAIDRLDRLGFIERRQGSGIFSLGQTGRPACILLDPRVFLLSGTSTFHSMLLEMLLGGAEEHDLALSIQFVPSDLGLTGEDADLLGVLGSDLQEGVYEAAFCWCLHTDACAWLEKKGIPTVALWTSGSHDLLIDYDWFLRQGLTKLKAAGCRRVEWWSEQDNLHDQFDQAARDLGIEPGFRWDRPPLFDPMAPPEPPAIRAMAALREAAARNALPDGIVLLDDSYTQGLVMQAEAMGLRLGRDLEIATLEVAGSPLLWGWDHRIHCVTLDPAAVAQAILGGMSALASGSQDMPPPTASYLKWGRGWTTSIG